MQGVLLAFILWGYIYTSQQNPAPVPEPRHTNPAENEQNPDCESWRGDEIWNLMTIGGIMTAPTITDFRRVFWMVDLNMNDAIDKVEFNLLWKDCTSLQEVDVDSLYTFFVRSCSDQATDYGDITRDDIDTCYERMFGVTTDEPISRRIFDRAWISEDGGVLQNVPLKGCMRAGHFADLTDFCWDII
jgi:hypothetical protein